VSDNNFDADVSAETCKILENAASGKIDSLDHFKEVLWSQKREIECCRKLIQRKDDVIKVMATLLSSSRLIDDVSLLRMHSVCATTEFNYQEHAILHGKL
jgi:hypothetical protein